MAAGGETSQRNLNCPREGELGAQAAPHKPPAPSGWEWVPPRLCLLLEAGYSPGTAKEVKPCAWNQFGNISRRPTPPLSLSGHQHDRYQVSPELCWKCSLTQRITPSGRTRDREHREVHGKPEAGPHKAQLPFAPSLTQPPPLRQGEGEQSPLLCHQRTGGAPRTMSEPKGAALRCKPLPCRPARSRQGRRGEGAKDKAGGCVCPHPTQHTHPRV